MTGWVKSSRSGANGCVEVQWRKSSYSGGNGGNCVEVAGDAGGGLLVRDSKLGDASPVLYFRADEWAAFIAGVVNHEFDQPGGDGSNGG